MTAAVRPVAPLRAGSRSRSRGAATLEFAICLPFFVLMFFGTLDSCAGVFLQQTLDVATYEGSRIAARPTSTTAEVVARCEDWVTARGISDVRIETIPAEIAAAPPGSLIVVNASAPCDGSAIFFGPFYKGRRIEARFSCVRQSSIQ